MNILTKWWIMNAVLFFGFHMVCDDLLMVTVLATTLAISYGVGMLMSYFVYALLELHAKKD